MEISSTCVDNCSAPRTQAECEIGRLQQVSLISVNCAVLTDLQGQKNQYSFDAPVLSVCRGKIISVPDFRSDPSSGFLRSIMQYRIYNTTINACRQEKVIFRFPYARVVLHAFRLRKKNCLRSDPKAVLLRFSPHTRKECGLVSRLEEHVSENQSF